MQNHLRSTTFFMSALLSGLECEMSSTILYVRTLGLQVVLLFGEVIEPLGAGHEDCTHLIISSSLIHQDVNSPLLENPNTKNSAMPSLHWVSFLPYVFFQRCFVSLIRNETNTTLMPKSPEQQVQDSKVIRYSPWKAQAAVRNIRKTQRSLSF